MKINLNWIFNLKVKSSLKKVNLKLSRLLVTIINHRFQNKLENSKKKNYSSSSSSSNKNNKDINLQKVDLIEIKNNFALIVKLIINKKKIRNKIIETKKNANYQII